MRILVVVFVVLIVAAPYLLMRICVSRLLAGVESELAQAVRDSLRGPMNRLRWACLIGVAVCAFAGLTLALQSDSGLGLFGLISIFSIHAVAWPFWLPLARLLDKELEVRCVQNRWNSLGPSRSATLIPRTIELYLPVWLLVLPWIATIGYSGYISWLMLEHPPAIAGIGALILLFLVTAWSLLVTYTLIIWKAALQSYPVNASDEIAAEQITRNEFTRRFQIVGFYGSMVLLLGLFLETARVYVESFIDGIPYGGHGHSPIVLYLGIFLGLVAIVWNTAASILYFRMMRTNAGPSSGRATKQ